MKIGSIDNGALIKEILSGVDKIIKILGVGDARVETFVEDELLKIGFDRVILLPCNLRKVLVTLEEML